MLHNDISPSSSAPAQSPVTSALEMCQLDGDIINIMQRKSTLSDLKQGDDSTPHLPVLICLSPCHDSERCHIIELQARWRHHTTVCEALGLNNPRATVVPHLSITVTHRLHEHIRTDEWSTKINTWRASYLAYEHLMRRPCQWWRWSYGQWQYLGGRRSDHSQAIVTTHHYSFLHDSLWTNHSQ